MIVDSIVVRLFHAVAITICPFIFVDRDLFGPARGRVIKHEWEHFWQQFLFGVIGALAGAVTWLVLSWPPQPAMVATLSLGVLEGWVAGQLLWRALYLLCLPVWYNPFRHRWEIAAFRAEGLGDDEIKEILRKAPYYLR